MIKDYLGHEINIGDILLYNGKGCHGYCSSFSEGVVVAINRGKPEICDLDDLDEYKNRDKYHSYTNVKFAANTINLTALNIRERVDV